MTNREVGAMIKKRRTDARMTADELGDKIGKDGRTVLRYESGDLDMKLSALIAIAEAFGVSVIGLLSGAPAVMKKKNPIEVRVYQLEDRMEASKIFVKNGYTVSQVKVSKEGQKTVEYRLRLEEGDDNIRIIK